jgi:uncharacterized membrane protein
MVHTNIFWYADKQIRSAFEFRWWGLERAEVSPASTCIRIIIIAEWKVNATGQILYTVCQVPMAALALWPLAQLLDLLLVNKLILINFYCSNQIKD